jgi:hypothetical protein
MSTVDGTFKISDLLVLQEASRRLPEDRDLQFLVATQYKNLGEYELSASRYREIVERYPDDLGARVNLGNIYFAQRDWEGAILEYDLVIQNHPRSAIAFYNKSLAHAENFQFREREEAFARAGSLDDGRVASHERRTGERRAVADVKLGPDEILAKFYGLEQGQHPTPVHPSWIGAFGGVGLPFLVVPLVFGGVLVVLERSLRRHGAQRCLKCGRAFCRRCQIGKDHRGLCTQCYHLFFVRNGVSASARKEKMFEVRKAGQTRGLVFRALSVAAPGAGHIAEDMPLFGMPLLVLWVCGWMSILFANRLYPLPDAITLLGASLGVYLTIGLLLALLLAVANTIAQPRLRR